jgi:L-alanine-DL-glutamate epimerase-like enolase superfamily enzyme
VLYDALRDLPLRIDAAETETLSRVISPEFTRRTTVFHLRGDGEEGVGEDVTYDPREHDSDHLPPLELAGDWTLASLSAHLDGIDLFPAGDQSQAAYQDYRRWGIESAALDLALRQAGRSLGDALGLSARPVRFVSSNRGAAVEQWLDLYPSLRFKLDPTPEWTDEFVTALGGRGVVDVVDLKGAYEGTPVDNPANPELYERVAEAFPDAWIEDPKLTPETDEVLRPHRDRITWDAPIHSWADVEALPFAPRCLNVKPSRFGALERLFEFYDRCAEQGIALYGGGQFELGPGRGQIQLLAALFSADGPNDVAPGGYNDPEPRPGLETSPLDPRPEPTGFRRSAA